MKIKPLFFVTALLWGGVGVAQAQTNLRSENPFSEDVLINGIRWATSNVNMPGTFAANPEDAGVFYQWGSNVGWSSTDPLTATDGINTWRDLSESGTTWLPAKNPCPDGWRVPTLIELESLGSVTNEWSNLNGVDGYLFGDGEPKLFLPAAGYRDASNGSLYDTGTFGTYWSNTPDSTNACNLYFSSGGFHTNGSYHRADDFSVRCVSE